MAGKQIVHLLVVRDLIAVWSKHSRGILCLGGTKVLWTLRRAPVDVYMYSGRPGEVYFRFIDTIRSR